MSINAKLTLTHSVPDCDVRYTMVGHIMVISSTVQIHTLVLSDNEVQISAARRRLERNFEIMNELRTYWPTLDIALTRSRASIRGAEIRWMSRSGWTGGCCGSCTSLQNRSMIG